MMEPNFGDRVFVRPRLGLRVQVSGVIGRFMDDAGQWVLWDVWYHARWRDGAIEIVWDYKDDE